MRLRGKAWANKAFKGVFGTLTKLDKSTPLKTAKRSKYNNKKTIVDNIKFDSKKEANRYRKLKLLLKAGKISELRLQEKFVIQDGFIKYGKTYRPVYYIADFFYYDVENKRAVVEDVKGVRLPVYLLKLKMFEYRYPLLTIVEI